MDLNRIRKLAGLTESYDDDTMTRSERELADMADRDLKKKGINVKVDPDKDMERLAKKVKKKEEKELDDDAEEAKPEEKKDNAEEAKAKSDTKPEEKKDDSGKPARGEHRAQAREYMKDHAGKGRAAFMAFAKSIGMGVGNATHFWQHNRPASPVKGVSEWFVLVHPSLPHYQLAENCEMGTYQWVDAYSNIEPLAFTKLEEATKLADHLLQWKSCVADIQKVVDEE